MTADTMDLGVTARLAPMLDQVKEIVRNRTAPLSAEFEAEVEIDGRWTHTPRQTQILETLKNEARQKGLWNLWLTDSERGSGLTTVEYAYVAEEMGRTLLGAETFNCSAPDTGNMEVLERFGSEAQQERWLLPLLDGTIRSAYLMTEPDVASSDATNINMSCIRDGDDYVLNGEKWWASGAGDPRCKLYIVMVRMTDADMPRHQQHSMLLVDPQSPGIEVLRPMTVYGQDDAPHGHMHIRFTDVRVPADQIVVGEGQGFAIAQGRLGPGRIHHCMRAIGHAESALEQLCRRALDREAFGKPLAALGQNYDIIAEARMEIEMVRLLCLKAAWMMDKGDPKAAAPWISQIKVMAPKVALKVVDEAAQLHGGMGLSQDTSLAKSWTLLRTLRMADGPDAVHRRQVARAELGRYTQREV